MLAATSPGPAAFLFAVAVDAVLSLLIYRHAERRGSRHPTAWGVLTFLFAGITIPLYWLHYLRSRRTSG
jgi:hypothetical protein